MFEEKDYIMKMVKQFTIAIGKIMKLKLENKIEESQDVLSETLKYFINLDKEIIEALPSEILIHKVSGGRQLHTEKCLMLSELLKQQADLYEINGETSKSRNLYIKSLNILLNVLLIADDSTMAENCEKVNELTEKLKKIELTNESKLLLLQYYELSKEYAKAEDVLFDLIETTGTKKDILANGIAFYERLVTTDPIDLEKGNLPLDEVYEGLSSLKDRWNKQ